MTIKTFSDSEGADAIRAKLNANDVELDARLLNNALLRGGWAQYVNTAAAVSIPGDGSGVDLAVNASSANETHLPSDVSSPWNPVTNRFDLNSLEIGDFLQISLSAIVTTSVSSQAVELLLEAGLGATPWRLNMGQPVFSAAGVNDPVGAAVWLPVRDATIQANPARIFARSSAPAQIQALTLDVFVFKRGGVPALSDGA